MYSCTVGPFMNIEQIRNQFPIFENKKDKPFIYLDNAATTQKPQVMIDAIVDFYTKHNANIHRGIYTFGEQATQLYEDARATVAQTIGAQPDEIVFVKNATEGINLVAYSWAMQHIKKGNEILLTQYEHHANLLPWQRVAQKTGAKLKFLPVHDDGTLAYEQLPKFVSNHAKLIACSALSNVTGAKTEIATLAKVAHKVGAKLLIDAAQLIAHDTVDVKKENIDFLVFSGHKVFGPTGIGVLYIKKELQDSMVPYQLGGGMVFDVDWYKANYLNGPQKFEAGTPPIAQAIGLAAALQWLQKQNMHDIQQHESALMKQLISGLQAIPAIRILGPIEQLKKQGHLLSFVVEGMHAHDVAAFLSDYGIAVRAGHHCVQPLAKKWNIDASVRVSLACYNTSNEIDQLVKNMEKIKKV